MTAVNNCVDDRYIMESAKGEETSEQTISEIKSPHKKTAIKHIEEILRLYSDSEHPMTQNDIMKKLQENYHIVIDRRAVSRNINALIDEHVNIEKTKKGSYLAGRLFEDSEIRILIHSILASRYISSKHSKALIDKLCSLSTKYFSEKIEKEVDNIFSADYDKHSARTENKQFLENVNKISMAIEKGKKINYEFYKYDYKKKMKKTSNWKVSPYKLLVNNQRYYLLAYCEEIEKFVCQRVDHFRNIEVLEESGIPLKTIKGHEKWDNNSKLATTMPYMYTDEPQEVVFRADIKIVDDIIEWFGKKVEITEGRNDREILVTHTVSPSAMHYWALQYVNSVEIISPESLRNKVKESLQNGLDKYNE